MKKIFWAVSLFFAFAFSNPCWSVTDPAPADNAASTATVDSSSASGVDASMVDDSRELESVPAQLDLLRFLGWCTIVVATAAGLLVYSYLHRHYKPNDSLFGLITVVVVAPLLLALSMACMSPSTQNCLGRSLPSGADASTIDTSCRDARESAANLAGFKSAWTRVVGQQTTATGDVPIASSVVKLLMFLSVLLSSIVLYFALKFAALKALAY